MSFLLVFTHTTNMFTLMIRVSIIALLMLTVMRIMGKRTLGEMQPFEFVLSLILSDLACTPLSDPGIPLWFGIIPILVLLVVHYLLSFIARKSIGFRKVLDGSSVVVFSPSGVEYQALKLLNMNIDDLIDAAIGQGYNLTDIYLAYFQTNGKLCVIPKEEKRNATFGDLTALNNNGEKQSTNENQQQSNQTQQSNSQHTLKALKQQSTLPIPFIFDGHFCNLEKFSKTKEEFQNTLTQLGYNYKDVMVATIDSYGEVFLQTKKDLPTTLNLPQLAYKEP